MKIDFVVPAIISSSQYGETEPVVRWLVQRLVQMVYKVAVTASVKGVVN